MHAADVTIRRLGPDDAEAYHALRLMGLADFPIAFGSSPDEEAALPIETVRGRLQLAGPNAVFGAFAGSDLVGVAGFVLNERLKQRHKGMLWGVFVSSQWQRQGLGASLVRAVIAHARQHVLVVQAHVAMSNDTARAMYRALDFVPYGVERKALYVDGAFHDDELIALEFGPAS
jgi:ribosomal protein S18 acetylase RimI-like enzyme